MQTFEQHEAIYQASPAGEYTRYMNLEHAKFCAGKSTPPTVTQEDLDRIAAVMYATDSSASTAMFDLGINA